MSCTSCIKAPECGEDNSAWLDKPARRTDQLEIMSAEDRFVCELQESAYADGFRLSHFAS